MTGRIIFPTTTTTALTTAPTTTPIPTPQAPTYIPPQLHHPNGAIIYWCQSTYRLNDNYAFELARWLSTSRGVELHVIVTVSEELLNDIYLADEACLSNTTNNFTTTTTATTTSIDSCCHNGNGGRAISTQHVLSRKSWLHLGKC